VILGSDGSEREHEGSRHTATRFMWFPLSRP